LIETENLTRKFGGLTAVDDLTFHVDDGEVFGFLGPNGAGKTTTIRMLACLISKTSGTAKIGDYDTGNSTDQQKIRRIIGLVPDNVGLYEELTAYKNLDFYGRYYKVEEPKRSERIEYFLKMMGLWDKRDVAAGTFSKGMKQKLAIARALVHDPEVLFMDEPTANLDPEAAKAVRDFILDLKKEKKTIFLNTHNLDEAQRICDRIAILNTKLVAMGTPAELERSASGRRIVVQLESLSDAIVSAAQGAGAGDVEAVEDNKLVITVGDPEKENPNILSAIFAAGGRVQFVTEANSTLEDVYLKLVRSK
jgi:ABC-2 type transport system ATP-binding protein